MKPKRPPRLNLRSFRRCSRHSMNGSQTIRTAGRIGGFCARHFLALVVTVAAPCVLWTLAYFALLIWAAASDGGIGSPIAYPLMLFFIVVGATAVALTVFFLRPPLPSGLRAGVVFQSWLRFLLVSQSSRSSASPSQASSLLPALIRSATSSPTSYFCFWPTWFPSGFIGG
jgi:hypothetical protein